MNNIQNACALLIQELYKTEPTGGDIHIVTDDFNVENSDLAWCEHYIKEQNKQTTDVGILELAILWGLALLTEKERMEVVTNDCGTY